MFSSYVIYFVDFVYNSSDSLSFIEIFFVRNMADGNISEAEEDNSFSYNAVLHLSSSRDALYTDNSLVRI